MGSSACQHSTKPKYLASAADRPPIIVAGSCIQFKDVLRRNTAPSPAGTDRPARLSQDAGIDPGAPPDLGDAHLWVLLAASPGVILATGDRLLLKKAPGGVAVVCPRAFVEDTVEAA
jgi:hypothetical protein